MQHPASLTDCLARHTRQHTGRLTTAGLTATVAAAAAVVLWEQRMKLSVLSCGQHTEHCEGHEH
jgi:hypothetical protein